MMESKVSVVSRLTGSRFGDISVIGAVGGSNAPGFSPVGCPSHPSYAITNICKSESCIEPLCPQCIPKHIRLHEQSKKPAKIQTLVATRVGCIERLAEQKFYVQSDMEKLEQHYSLSAEGIRQQLTNKLNSSKGRVMRLIDKLYERLQKNVEVIYSAYVLESERNHQELCRQAAPLNDYLNTVNSYKSELESDDFISALIEVLSDFPKRPEVRLDGKKENFGDVLIDEKAIEDIQKSVERFVQVRVNCKEQRINNLMNSGSSNNLMFSRLDRSKSSQSMTKTLVAGLDSRQSRRNLPIFGNQRSSSGSRSKIFPASQQQSSPRESSPGASHKVNYEVSRELTTSITQPNYFKSATGSIIYCQDNTTTCYRADIATLESGFEKSELDLAFKIPEHHRVVVTPNNQAFLLGGRWQYQVSNKHFRVVPPLLEEQPSMITPRAMFGCCVNGQYIYALGGITSMSNGMTNKFERYHVPKRSWSALKACNEPNYGCELVAFNHMIIKVGGKTENNSTPNQLELYNTINDTWKVLTIEPSILRLPMTPGLAQISSTELLLFGGLLGDIKQNECYKLTFNNQTISIRRCCELYSQSTFSNGSLVHNRQVLAVQNSSRGTTKNLVRFTGSTWKFISC